MLQPYLSRVEYTLHLTKIINKMGSSNIFLQAQRLWVGKHLVLILAYIS